MEMKISEYCFIRKFFIVIGITSVLYGLCFDNLSVLSAASAIWPGGKNSQNLKSNSRPDHARLILPTTATDTLEQNIAKLTTPSERYNYLERVFTYNKLFSRPIEKKNEALNIAYRMLSEAQTMSGRLKLAEAHERIAKLMELEGRYADAILEWKEAYNGWDFLNNRKHQGNAILQIVRLDLEIKNYTHAMEQCKAAMAVYQKIKYKDGIAQVYIQMGDIHLLTGKTEEAIDSYEEVLSMKEFILDAKNLAMAKYKLGQAFAQNQNNNKARNKIITKLFKEAKDEWLHMKDTLSSAVVSQALAHRYHTESDKQGAIQNYEDALNIYTNYSRYKEAAGISNELAKLYFSYKDYVLTLKYTDITFKFAKYSGSRIALRNAYERYYDLAYIQDDKPNALKYLKLFSELKDSINLEQNLKHSTELRIRFESEKKIRDIESGKLDNSLLLARTEEQKTIRNSLIGGSIIVLVLAFVLLQRYRYDRLTNKQLKYQNEEINKRNIALHDTHKNVSTTIERVNQQKIEIEEKNQRIEDGVKYAFRMQSAILPPMERIMKAFPENFIFYRPRDIVSGDFYWFEDSSDYTYLAAVDCTGHGVPGAFMSVVAYNMLNQIISELQKETPDEILEELDRLVRLSLHQDDSTGNKGKDGMDIALCAIDPNRTVLYYAGAGRPLYRVGNGELSEIKGDKFPVGGAQHENKKFALHLIKLKKGDRFYLFSDGITDQFGGPNKRKFSSMRLQEFIVSHQYQSLAEQRKSFIETFDSWQGIHKQLDDVMLIGFEV